MTNSYEIVSNNLFTIDAIVYVYIRISKDLRVTKEEEARCGDSQQGIGKHSSSGQQEEQQQECFRNTIHKSDDIKSVESRIPRGTRGGIRRWIVLSDVFCILRTRLGRLVEDGTGPHTAKPRTTTMAIESEVKITHE